MSDKLGFTFYPKDWWTSESYFELTPIQRYYYLECLFIMYSNDGLMKTQKTQFENRTRTMVLQNDWEIVISKFELINDNYTHVSVNKRLRKAVANRENGKLGGRPKKEVEKPKEPSLETQKNPPLEREREREIEKETKEKLIQNKNDLIFNELIISEGWLETVAMNSKHKFNPSQVKSWLKKYNTTINNQFDYKNNKTEYCSHFTRWLDTREKTENKPKQTLL
jgi:hypothetical protein